MKEEINKNIDGRYVASVLRCNTAKLASDIEKRYKKKPGLAVVRVGDNLASAVYVRNKLKQARECGVQAYEYKFGADVLQGEVVRLIDDLNADPNVHGILVQLPLPLSLDSDCIIESIDPRKDVDGLHSTNISQLLLARSLRVLEDIFVPCTPLGCLILAKTYLGNLEGMNALVVGRSQLVGKPLAALLLLYGVTVTVAHSKTRERDLKSLCQQADLLFSAVGQSHFIDGDWIKNGATVIDVGINHIKSAIGSTKIVGDVNYSTAVEKARFITPVPGGVGPMTVACLLSNTVASFCRFHKMHFSQVLDIPFDVFT